MINEDNQLCFSKLESLPNSFISSSILLLNKIYEKCLSGGYGFDSAYEIAETHQNFFKNHDNALNILIKQESKKAALGAVFTGLGGVISLPITIPANLISTLFIQMRLVTAIAILQGYDVKEEKIKVLVYISLCVMPGKQKMWKTFVNLIHKSNQEVIKKISLNINNILISIMNLKHGTKIIRLFPFIGSVTGGVIDGLMTYQIGQFAKRQFSQLAS